MAKEIGKLALVPENLIDFIFKHLPNLLQTITDPQITILKEDQFLPQRRWILSISSKSDLSLSRRPSVCKMKTQP
jgi:hypothetical protein